MVSVRERELYLPCLSFCPFLLMLLQHQNDGGALKVGVAATGAIIILAGASLANAISEP